MIRGILSSANDGCPHNPQDLLLALFFSPEKRKHKNHNQAPKLGTAGFTGLRRAG